MSILSNTILFNVRTASEFYNPLSESSDGTYYIFAATSNTYSNGVSENITESVYDLDSRYLNEIIFSKRISPDDVRLMVNRYDWTPSTVYSQYDDKDPDLFSKRFFVVSENNGYHVFKCINNNGDSPSTVKPIYTDTSPAEEIYTTGDGYVWKYMYSIPNSVWNKFKTNTYIPVIENPLTKHYAVNGAIDSILLVSGGNNYYSHTSGFFKGTAVSGNTLVYAIDIDTSSSNNGFYKNSAVYVDSGLGFGQVRNISDYINTGDQHQIVIDSPFDVIPNTNSHYSIAPAVNIIGDGSGAVAVCSVNNNTIDKFDIISRGTNYSFANVYITGNTGITGSNGASARVVISPSGGHGSNVFAELNASKIGFSLQFSNTEANVINETIKFSRIGIVKDLEMANVWLTYNSSNTGSFIPTETVNQYLESQSNTNIYTTNFSESVFNISDYVKLSLNAVSTFTNGSIIVQSNNSLNYGRICSTTGSNLVVKVLGGNFSAGVPLQLSGNTAVNNFINSVTQGFSNTLFGYNSENVAWVSSANNYDVYINSDRIYSSKYLPVSTNSPYWSVSSNVISFSNMTLSNNDQVIVQSYNYIASLGSKNVAAIATLDSANTTVLKLSNAKGVFRVSNDSLISLSSNNSVKITAISGQPTVLDHTLRVFGQYQLGSFSSGDYVEQKTNDYVNAFGYISSIKDEGSGNYTIRLIGVYGSFESSGGTDKYLQSKDQTKKFKIVSQILPDVVKGKGKIIYAENLVPVGRANNQPSETIKTVIKFY